MRHLTPRALVARVGRRGGCLLFFAFLDLTYGRFLGWPPPQVRLSPQIVYATSVLPLPVWAGLWFLAGGACLGGAFLRQDFVAFVAAMMIKAGWGVLTAAGWLAGKVPLGQVSAAIWLAMAGLVAVLSGWPEPVRPVRRVRPGE